MDEICPPGTAFAAAAAAVRRGEQDPVGAAAGLVEQLTDRELLGLLDGDLTFRQMARRFARSKGTLPLLPAGTVERLGIPGFLFTDGPRGVTGGRCTSFPVAIARAASWDTELERSVGDAMGAEARAVGRNQIGAPCINLAVDPGWGRSQESYGEDPELLGAMGVAFSEGAQPWVMPTVKHYAVNSMEEARFRVDVTVAENILREVYLPHFRQVVESGVDVVMSAYNAVNGEWCGQHHHLLTEILRDEWGFAGTVQTDWMWGLRDPVLSVQAGLDVEMPLAQQRARELPSAARDGRLDRDDVVRSATRIVATQLRLAARARPTPLPDVIASDEHRALARDVARRGTVLLRNEPVGGSPLLPLDESSLGRLAVIGPLADGHIMGDVGSSRVHAPSSVTVLEGLRERLGDRVVHADATDTGVAIEAAGSADAVVVVVGLSSEDEGEALLGLDEESIGLFGGIARFRPVAKALGALGRFAARFAKWGGDRRDLRLHAEDVQLIQDVASVNAGTIVVVIGGGTIVMDPWDRDVAAVLMAWYPGMEGGRAVADILFGDHEPGGRLPVTIPHRRSDLPVLDWDAEAVTYDRWWGQRKLDRDGIAAAYPFGFGLGFTTFDLEDLEIGPVDGERFPADVTVVNTGNRDGRHVVQVYAHLREGDRPVRALVGFISVAVAAGERARVRVECSTRPLQRWTGDGFAIPVESVMLEAASHSGDPNALIASLEGLAQPS